MMSKTEVLAAMVTRQDMLVSRLAWFDAEMAAVSLTDLHGQVWDRARTAKALAEVGAAIAHVTAN
jgi:hypothetical protein